MQREKNKNSLTGRPWVTLHNSEDVNFVGKSTGILPAGAEKGDDTAGDVEVQQLEAPQVQEELEDDTANTQGPGQHGQALDTC